MRRVIALFLVFAAVLLTGTMELYAQDAGEVAGPSGFQLLKKYFIEGDWRFMSLVLVTLILGLAFCIERIISLNIATTNTEKLIGSIDDELANGNVNGAMEVCKATLVLLPVSCTKVSRSLTKVPMRSKRPLCPTAVSKWVCWSAAWSGFRSSLPRHPCSGLWVR